MKFKEQMNSRIFYNFPNVIFQHSRCMQRLYCGINIGK